MVTARKAAYVVVGCGPRGLNVVERFVWHARHDPEQRPQTLHIVEPGRCGPGIHHEQRDYLLLNTIADQLTTFVDADMVPGGGVNGPSLYEWASQRRLTTTSRAGVHPVQRTDHLPRRLLGEYLVWAAERILEACPPWLAVTVHRELAVAIRSGPDSLERVTLRSGEVIEANHVVITVGHSGMPSPQPPADVPPSAWIPTPYPLPDTLANVKAGAVLGLLGSGLTAMDVIAACTVGRGGTYEQSRDRLRYRPSGAEPELVLVSRSGRPARARPLPYRHGSPPAQFLTEAAVRHARAARPEGKLDLDHDVLPLVWAEMRHRIAERVSGEVADEVTAQALAGWAGAVPASALSDMESFQGWALGQVQGDLVEARRGLDGSALKYAYEVVRDYREVLRQAVDTPGLSQDSRRRFFGRFAGEVNSNVIGPQLERNEELVALAEAGVVKFGPGPEPKLLWQTDGWTLVSTVLVQPEAVRLDTVVAAFSPCPSVSGSRNPLVSNLQSAGRLHATMVGDAESGAAVDRLGHPLGDTGRPQTTLTILGPLAEGSSYYNHYVTSPGRPSRATLDADRAVRSALRGANR